MGTEKLGGALAIIGAILTFIAPLLPVAHMDWAFFGHSGDVYYWMWGYSYHEWEGWLSSGSDSHFEPEMYGIVCGSVIIIVALISFVLGAQLTNRKIGSKTGGAGLFLMAIIAIASMVAWMVLINDQSTVIIGITIHWEFWDRFDPSYGVFVLFAGAVIIIFGAILALIS